MTNTKGNLSQLSQHIAPDGRNFIVLPFPAYTALTQWAVKNGIDLPHDLYNAGEAFSKFGIAPDTDYIPAGNLSKSLQYAMEHHLKVVLFDCMSYDDMYRLVDQAWNHYHKAD